MLINLWGRDCFQQFHPIYCTRIGLLICPLSVYGGILWGFTGCYHVKCSYDCNGTYIRGFSFLCFSTEISTGVDLCFFIGFKNIKAISNRLWYFIKCDYSRGLFALFLYFFIILAFVRTTLSRMSETGGLLYLVCNCYFHNLCRIQYNINIHFATPEPTETASN